MLKQKRSYSNSKHSNDKEKKRFSAVFAAPSSVASAASSSISSYSFGSGSTWSLPKTGKNRSGGNTSNYYQEFCSEGVRRLGSSFRVSLRPLRYRSSNRENASISSLSSWPMKIDEEDDQRKNKKNYTTTKGAYCDHYNRKRCCSIWNRLYFYIIYPTIIISVVVYFISHYFYYSDVPSTFVEHYKDRTPSFYENIFSGKQDSLEKDTAAALRGSALEITTTTDTTEVIAYEEEVEFDAANIFTNVTKIGDRGYYLNDKYGRVKKYGFVGANNSTEEEAAAPVVRRDWTPVTRNSTMVTTNKDGLIVVGYILPIYSCYKLREQKKNYGLTDPETDREFQDAAVMLKASIHRNSARVPGKSQFDYEMVALIHRTVENCAGGANRTRLLEKIGYRVEVVREPVHARNIKNDYLRNNAPKSIDARIGMREMIRLYAFKMIDYRITVLMEPTTWLMRPPDGIYDAFLNGDVETNPWAINHPKHIVRDTFYPNGTVLTQHTLPKKVEIMFSRDYSALSHKSWTTGLSLAFVLIKPSVKLYRKLLNVYQSINYDPIHGWDSKGYAHYSGSMQTKGLLTYYYSELQPNAKLELHRCVYNNLADIPFVADKSGSRDNCRDVKEHKTLPDGSPMPCTDCRLQMYDEIVVVNFAICRSPWTCPYMKTVKVPLLRPTIELCRRFHEDWFALRQQVEQQQTNTTTSANGKFHPEIFHGYCQPGLVGGGAYVTMNRIN